MELSDLFSVSSISPTKVIKSSNRLPKIVKKVCLDSGWKNQFEGFGPTREYDIKIYLKKIASEDVLDWFRIRSVWKVVNKLMNRVMP